MAAIPTPITTLPIPACSNPMRGRLTTNSATPDAKMGAQQGSGHGRPIVQNGNGKAERKHADVVHRPDANSHGAGAPGQPRQPEASLGGGYTSGQIKRGVRGKGGDNDRQRHQVVVVGSRHRWMGRCHLPQ